MADRLRASMSHDAAPLARTCHARWGGGHVRRYGRSIGDSTAELPSVGCVCPRDKPAFGDRRVGTEEETMNRHLTHAWLVASIVVATLGATEVAAAQDPGFSNGGRQTAISAWTTPPSGDSPWQSSGTAELRLGSRQRPASSPIKSPSCGCS